jgi:probable rRNA maturation factor
MSIKLTIQNSSNIKTIPPKRLFKTWATTALAGRKKNCEITIRIVGVKEIAQLNKQYRKKNKPTNIIAFNFYPPPKVKSNLLGDLVICAPVAKLEAKLQHKTIISHWAHLTIHGVLHLLGYDHENAAEAKKMEKLEIKFLKALNFADPYN